MKKISCFLSSTFNDMQTERDFFRLSLEDKMNDNLKKAGLLLEFIDLRWGINVQTEEADYDKKVLSVCLSEIKKTKPFFIVFLGERYGWTPDKEDVLSVIYESGGKEEHFCGKSITEIEINYALESYVDTGKCLFYFRNPVDFGDDKIAKEKYVSTGEESRKLNELKERISKLLPNQIRTYDASWDKENGTFIIADDFKEKVANDIESLFKDEYESSLLDPEYIKQQRTISLTVERNSSLFAGREEELSKVQDYLSNSNNKILDIVSSSGTGKSYFISKVIKDVTLDTGRVILPYICDNTDEIFSLRELVEYYLQILGCDEALSSYTLAELIKKFQQTVNLLGCEKPVVILIDSVDRIIQNEKELPFLNTYAYNNVKFIITRNHDYPMAKYISAMDSTELLLENYKKCDIVDIAKKFFATAHRTVSDEFIEELIKKEQQNPQTCSTPSYLTLLLNALNNLSQKDFKIINKRAETEKKPFATVVELFQREKISVAGKTFEEELLSQKKRIEDILPAAKYYFEYLTVSPHGMSEREMDFVLEKLSMTQTATDFSMFTKAFKCFLIRDEGGFWHFSQRRVLDHFLSTMAQEKKDEYYRIILDLYNQDGKEALKDKYALLCYLRLNEYENAYNFLISKTKNKVVVESFVKYINSSSNYEDEILKLFGFDESRKLEEILSKILRQHDVVFYKWYDMLYKFYDRKRLKGILLDTENRYKVYNNLVSLAYLTYDYGEYKKGLKVVSKLNRYFGEKYVGTKLYNTYEMKTLEIIFKAKLGQIVKYGKIVSLMLDVVYSIKPKSEQNLEKWDISKRKILNLLKSTDRIYEATEETKERDRFNLDFIDNCLSLGYLERDEYIYWLSKKFAYLSRNSSLSEEEQNKSIFIRLSDKVIDKILKVDQSELDEIKEEKSKEKSILQAQYDEIVSYINDPSSNKELVATCCINMAKYCDNVNVKDDYTFTALAVETARENLKNRFSAKSIKNYNEALTQKVYESEMLGTLQAEDVVELLRASKLAILVAPTTKSYDTYFEMYEKCKKLNLLSSDDIKDKDKHIKKRKNEVKFEVSEEKQMIQKKRVIYGMIGVLALVLIVSAIFFVFRGYVIGIQLLSAFLFSMVTGFVGGIGANLLLYRNKKRNIIFGALLLVIYLLSLVYLLSYSISDEHIRKLIIDFGLSGVSALNYYYDMVYFGGKEFMEFAIKIVAIIPPAVFVLVNGAKFLSEYRTWRSSSDLRNYKAFVVEYPKRKNFVIITTIVHLVFQAVITVFLIHKWLAIKDLPSVQNIINRVGLFVLPMIVAMVVIMAFSELFQINNLRRFKREKQKYDKRALFEKENQK